MGAVVEVPFELATRVVLDCNQASARLPQFLDAALQAPAPADLPKDPPPRIDDAISAALPEPQIFLPPQPEDSAPDEPKEEPPAPEGTDEILTDTRIGTNGHSTDPVQPEPGPLPMKDLDLVAFAITKGEPALGQRIRLQYLTDQH